MRNLLMHRQMRRPFATGGLGEIPAAGDDLDRILQTGRNVCNDQLADDLGGGKPFGELAQDCDDRYAGAGHMGHHP